MAFYATFILVWGSLVSPTAFVNSAKILAIFPSTGKSHLNFNEAIMSYLRDAGHEVTFISPFADDESMKNYTIIDSRRNTSVVNDTYLINDLTKLNYLQLLDIFLDLEEKYCHDVLQLAIIQNLLNSTDVKTRQYDVMFVEILFINCFLPLAEKLNIPVIGTVTYRSWLNADKTIGNPHPPSVTPTELTSFTDRMTFYQRLANLFYYICYEYYTSLVGPSRVSKINRRYYQPELLRKKKEISLVFYNNHPSIFPRAQVPNAVDVAGIHTKSAKPLPQNLQKFVDEATNGVILFTLGSVIKSSSMPERTKNAFKEAFSRIPQRVIWKFDQKMDDLPNNVIIMKWVPQRDVLAHKNTKVFISHGGISGLYESIYEGVPMLITALFFDQRSNAATLEHFGVAVCMDLFATTADTIVNALNEIINDTKYYRNMQKLSRNFQDRPISLQETVVYWTEYVIRHKGANHLRTTAVDMPMYQYLLLDVILSVVLTVISMIFVIFYIVKTICFFCSTKVISEDFSKLRNAKKKL